MKADKTNRAADKPSPFKFSLGQIAIAPMAMDKLLPLDVAQALTRHAQGDWGDCGAEDKAKNDFAVDKDLQIFSEYHDSNGAEFWIITEACRSLTTVLSPEDC